RHRRPARGLSPRAVARQHELRRAPSRVEEVAPLLELAYLLAEADRDEAAGRGERSVVEPLSQRVDVAQVARWPELCARVSRPRNRVEDDERVGYVRRDADGELERTEAHRRVGDADHSVTSGTRGSFSKCSQAGRTHANAGSSAAAMERRSPASVFR